MLPMKHTMAQRFNRSGSVDQVEAAGFYRYLPFLQQRACWSIYDELEIMYICRLFHLKKIFTVHFETYIHIFFLIV